MVAIQLRPFMRLAWVVALLLVVAACEDKQPSLVSTTPGEGNGSSTSPNNQAPEGNVVEDNEPSHGPDESVAEIEAGFFNGTWRVATSDQDTPMVYFDLVQDAGQPVVTGQFLMSIALSEMLDGTAGDLLEASAQGEQLTIRWNPTTDEEESYELTTTAKVDVNTFDATVRSTRGEGNFTVRMTRRLDEENAPEVAVE